jgi:hypothetical protein
MTCIHNHTRAAGAGLVCVDCHESIRYDRASDRESTCIYCQAIMAERDSIVLENGEVVCGECVRDMIRLAGTRKASVTADPNMTPVPEFTVADIMAISDEEAVNG